MTQVYYYIRLFLLQLLYCILLQRISYHPIYTDYIFQLIFQSIWYVLPHLPL
nr:MAG TPA: hypothetical protein [Caudoviricetes sp.]